MHGFLESALLFLAAVAIGVPLFNRFRLGAVLAYLTIGAVVGPHAFGWIDMGGAERGVAELGVVLLLFLIGLELSPSRLWLMRRALLGVGTTQVLGSMLLLAPAIHAFGQSWTTALVASFALAMSSTAIGVQMLADRKELGTGHGRNVLAVLLLQDIVAIPAIAILPLLGAGALAHSVPVHGMWLALAKVVGAIAAVIVVGRFLVRPLFRSVAATRSVEAFTATTLLVALGTAWLVSLAGISMTLGAFLGGLLLAESEYRHEIEANIEPFKGLLLGLFFISVGLSVDWHYVGVHALDVVIGVVGLLLAKCIVLFLLGRYIAKLRSADAAKLAALLAQGGEFAFVLLTLAAQIALLDAPTHDLLTAVIVLSMAATPLLFLLLDRWLANQVAPQERPFDEITPEEDPRVIIAGFGRVGQIVARVLRAHRIPFTALEQSVEQVDNSRRFGSQIFYGDPSRPELLRAARADRAQLFVLATDDPEVNVRTARIVKRLYPHLRIYARARNRQHAFRLMDLSVEHIVRETLHSSLQMAELVLQGLGIPADTAKQRVERFRRHDEKLMAEQHLIYDDETKLVQSTKEAFSDLERIFEADLSSEVIPLAEAEIAAASGSAQPE